MDDMSDVEILEIVNSVPCYVCDSTDIDMVVYPFQLRRTCNNCGKEQHPKFFTDDTNHTNYRRFDAIVKRSKNIRIVVDNTRT